MSDNKVFELERQLAELRQQISILQHQVLATPLIENIVAQKEALEVEILNELQALRGRSAVALTNTSGDSTAFVLLDIGKSSSTPPENQLCDEEIHVVSFSGEERIGGLYSFQCIITAHEDLSESPFIEEILGRPVTLRIKRGIELVPFVVEEDISVEHIISNNLLEYFVQDAENSQQQFQRILNDNGELFELSKTIVQAKSTIFYPCDTNQYQEEDRKYRYINGVISSIRISQSQGNTRFFVIDIVPKLWIFDQNRRSRVYTNKSTEELVKEILTEGEPALYTVSISPEDTVSASEVAERISRIGGKLAPALSGTATTLTPANIFGPDGKTPYSAGEHIPPGTRVWYNARNGFYAYNIPETSYTPDDVRSLIRANSELAYAPAEGSFPLYSSANTTLLAMEPFSPRRTIYYALKTPPKISYTLQGNLSFTANECVNAITQNCTTDATRPKSGFSASNIYLTEEGTTSVNSGRVVAPATTVYYPLANSGCKGYTLPEKPISVDGIISAITSLQTGEKAPKAGLTAQDIYLDAQGKRLLQPSEAARGIYVYYPLAHSPLHEFCVLVPVESAIHRAQESLPASAHKIKELFWGKSPDSAAIEEPVPFGTEVWFETNILADELPFDMNIEALQTYLENKSEEKGKSYSSLQEFITDLQILNPSRVFTSETQLTKDTVVHYRLHEPERTSIRLNGTILVKPDEIVEQLRKEYSEQSKEISAEHLYKTNSISGGTVPSTGIAAGEYIYVPLTPTTFAAFKVPSLTWTTTEVVAHITSHCTAQGNRPATPFSASNLYRTSSTSNNDVFTTDIPAGTTVYYSLAQQLGSYTMPSQGAPYTSANDVVNEIVEKQTQPNTRPKINLQASDIQHNGQPLSSTTVLQKGDIVQYPVNSFLRGFTLPTKTVLKSQIALDIVAKRSSGDFPPRNGLAAGDIFTDEAGTTRIPDSVAEGTVVYYTPKDPIRVPYVVYPTALSAATVLQRIKSLTGMMAPKPSITLADLKNAETGATYTAESTIPYGTKIRYPLTDPAIAEDEVAFVLDSTFFTYEDPTTQTRMQRKRSLCIQYDESDYNFICRLLEDEGISFYFVHEKSKHTLVITDTYEGLALEGMPLTYSHSSLIHDSKLVHYQYEDGSSAGQYALNDYNYLNVTQELLEQEEIEGGLPQSRIAEFPGYPDEPDDYKVALSQYKERRVQRRAESVKIHRNIMRGASLLRTVQVGHSFFFEGEEHIPLAIKHVGHASYGYANRFEAYLPLDEEYHKRMAYRPLRKTPKPNISGVHHAVVVEAPSAAEAAEGEGNSGGKYGEMPEIEPNMVKTDRDLGRVRLIFYWDSTRTTTDWIRVNQQWAGYKFGFQFLPRTGMEVLVAFEYGDPDRPIVVGSAYNNTNKPKYNADSQYSGISSWAKDIPGIEGTEDGKIMKDAITKTASPLKVWVPKLKGWTVGVAARAKHDPNKAIAKSIGSATKDFENGFNEIRFRDTAEKQEFFTAAPMTRSTLTVEQELNLLAGERISYLWGDFGPGSLEKLRKTLVDDVNVDMGSTSPEDVPSKMHYLIGIADMMNGAPKSFDYINGNRVAYINGNDSLATFGNYEVLVHGPKFELKHTGYGYFMPPGCVNHWLSLAMSLATKALGKSIKKAVATKWASKYGEMFAKVCARILSMLIPGNSAIKINYAVGWEIIILQWLLEMPLLPGTAAFNGLFALLYAIPKIGFAGSMVQTEIVSNGNIEISAANQITLKAPKIVLETPNGIEETVNQNFHTAMVLAKKLLGDKTSIELNALGWSPPHELIEALEHAHIPMPGVFDIEIMGANISASGSTEIEMAGGLEGINSYAWLSEISETALETQIRSLEHKQIHGKSQIESVYHTEKFVNQDTDVATDKSLVALSNEIKAIYFTIKSVEENCEFIEMSEQAIERTRKTLNETSDQLNRNESTLVEEKNSATETHNKALSEKSHALDITT